MLPAPVFPRPAQKIRVLVVDDSVVIRKLVTDVLSEDPALEVVGVAANGVIALQKIPQLNPDVVTMDVEMPELNGIETVRRIRQNKYAVRVIMFSTLTERGASTTIEALASGADDYVAKASNVGSLDKSRESLRTQLIPRIKQFFRVASAPVAAPRPTLVRPAAAGPRLRLRPKVVVIGVSTGGPNALSAVVPMLPANFPVPILIVQHMPPVFTRLLAERLQSQSKLRVLEAAAGMPVQTGTILIAPGDYHLRVRRNGQAVVTSLDQGPPENSCRPAADVLFRSAAEVWEGAVLPVVLTGMGQDGLRGVEQLRAKGAHTIVQDEATSTVWGMPGAVATAGLADAIVPLGQVAAEILKQF